MLEALTRYSSARAGSANQIDDVRQSRLNQIVAKWAEAARFSDPSRPYCVFKEIIQPWLSLRKYVDNNNRQCVDDTKRYSYSKFH